MKIEDGSGSGRLAAVNKSQELKTFSVIESETEAAADKGLGFNLNSGEITGITSGDATLLYFKNGEDTTYIVDAIAVGLRGFTGLTDMATVTVLKNPQSGDLISDSIAADIKSNTNFGSANELVTDTLLYKGKNSGTISGEDEIHAILYTGNSFGR